MKKQYKKYKFDAAMPFEFVNTVDFVNVSLLLTAFITELIELIHTPTVLEQFVDECYVH